MAEVQVEFRADSVRLTVNYHEIILTAKQAVELSSLLEFAAASAEEHDGWEEQGTIYGSDS